MKEGLGSSMRALVGLMILVVVAVSPSLVGAESEGPKLTTTRIQKALSAAVAKAKEIRVPMGISVVNDQGNLVGFIKMDGTFAHTNHTSFSKAYTAASIRRATHETKIPPKITAEIASVTGGKFTVLPGGFPLIVKGKVVGGIGVGGGNAEEDMAVAKAGAEAVK
ncbi:MAG: heme-binding protein [Nitrospiraceae bacterium]